MRLLSAFRFSLIVFIAVSFSLTLSAQVECNDPIACNYNSLDTADTDCCFADCQSLIMTDSFGDGWNGAVYNIVDSSTGDVIQSGTLEAGSGPETHFFCMPSGCYSFSVGGGVFDGEIAWTLVGADVGTLSGTGLSSAYFSINSETCEFGCIDSLACNFNSQATDDDGSCFYECNGCLDSTACNYDSTATVDDGSCLFAPTNDTYETSQTATFGDSYIGDLCCASTAIENPCLPGTPSFDVWYHANSSSCEDIQFNVTNIDGASLGMTIWVDSCQGCNDIYPIACCPEVTGTCAGSMIAVTSLQSNWDYYFSVWTTNPAECGTFSFSLECTSEGCMDSLACNFDPNALDDDGSCEYFDACGVCGGTGVPGCNNPNACNYDPAASCSDGSCIFPELFYLDCDGNCLNDSNNDGICDGEPVFGCNTEFACNYNPIVTDDDGSCFFATAVYDCDGNCQQDADGDGICDQNEGQNGAEFCGGGTVWDPVTQTCIGFDPCPGDLNNDGVVDTTDILLLLISFGTACD